MHYLSRLLSCATVKCSFRSYYTHLERGVVSVKGEDTAKFLHGIVTSNVNALMMSPSHPPAQFSVFLNHAGRVLFDVFLWRSSNVTNEREVLIDCQRPYVLDLMIHLQFYKVRSKVTIQDVSDDYRVCAAEESEEQFVKHSRQAAIGAIRDKRSKRWQMSRYLVGKAQSLESIFACELPSATRHEYRLSRMCHGVPEGFVEIKSGAAIPFDYNLDLMGAIEFDKGCYTGQELITRTRHQGQIRKRCRPVRLFDPDTQSILGSFRFDADFSQRLKVIPDTELMGAQVKGSSDATTDYSAQHELKLGRIMRTIGNVGICIIREDNLLKQSSNYAALRSEAPAMILVEIMDI